MRFHTVFGGFQHGSIGQDPGAVEEDVQIAKLVDRASHHLAHLVRLRYVQARKQGFSAGGANLVHGFHAAALAGVGHHHRRAFPGKADGHRPRYAGTQRR